MCRHSVPTRDKWTLHGGDCAAATSCGGTRRTSTIANGKVFPTLYSSFCVGSPRDAGHGDGDYLEGSSFPHAMACGTDERHTFVSLRFTSRRDLVVPLDLGSCSADGVCDVLQVINFSLFPYRLLAAAIVGGAMPRIALSPALVVSIVGHLRCRGHRRWSSGLPSVVRRVKCQAGPPVFSCSVHCQAGMMYINY